MCQLYNAEKQTDIMLIHLFVKKILYSNEPPGIKTDRKLTALTVMLRK